MQGKVLLTSASEIKHAAMRSVFPQLKIDVLLNANEDTPPQPVGIGGLVAAKMRIEKVNEHLRAMYPIIYSIESAIENNLDVVWVVALDVFSGLYSAVKGGGVEFDAKYLHEVRQHPHPSGLGYTKTIGECTGKDPKNWMGNRQKQIEDVLRAFVTTPNARLSLHANMRFGTNFPKQGVLFHEMSPILRSPDLMEWLREEFFDLLHGYKFNIVAGLESRGFIFGMMLAQQFNTPFAMIRKAGKLPPPTRTVVYELEYGTATLEMPEGAFDGVKDPRVLLVDDAVATGGSLRAACQLVRAVCGTVAACAVVLRVPGFDSKIENLVAVID